MYDYWYQFDNFNSYISNIASNYKSDWKYPLYFGNMYKGNEHYETFKTHAKGLTNINNYDDNYYYAVNNSNGMYWQMGSNDKKYYTYSLLGLMNNKLDSKGDLQVINGVKAPYFDAEALSTATYNGARVANVYKSSFPFRTTTDSAGVTTYELLQRVQPITSTLHGTALHLKKLTTVRAKHMVYTMIWENSAVQKTVMVFSHSTILRIHQRARVLTVTLTMALVSDLI